MSSSSPQFTPTQPHPRNLLELYRQHRDELDVLTDETSLFLLGFLQQIGTAHAGELSRELNLPMAVLSEKLQRLTRAQLIAAGATGLTITAVGAQLIKEIGLGALLPPVPPSSSQVPPPQTPPPATPPAAGAAATAAGGSAVAAGGMSALVLGALAAVGGIIVVGAVALGIIWTIVSAPTPTPPPPTPVPTTAPAPTPVPTRLPLPTVVPTPVTRLPPVTGTAPSAGHCVLRLLPGAPSGTEIPVTFEVGSECPDGIGDITAGYEDRSTPYKMFPPFSFRSGSIHDTPLSRCPQEGKYKIKYVFTWHTTTGDIQVTATVEGTNIC